MLFYKLLVWFFQGLKQLAAGNTFKERCGDTGGGVSVGVWPCTGQSNPPQKPAGLLSKGPLQWDADRLVWCKGLWFPGCWQNNQTLRAWGTLPFHVTAPLDFPIMHNFPALLLLASFHILLHSHLSQMLLWLLPSLEENILIVEKKKVILTSKAQEAVQDFM